MLLSNKSDLVLLLDDICVAFESTAKGLYAMEQTLLERFGLELLLDYRRCVAEVAGSQMHDVEKFWLESARECLGSLGESIFFRNSKPWPGIYRSSFIDALWAGRVRTTDLVYPIEVLNKLSISASDDKEFAYDFRWRFTAKRQREAEKHFDRLASGIGDDINSVANYFSPVFGLIKDRRGSKARTLFIAPGAGALQLGLMLQEGRGKSSMFDVVIIPRSEKKIIKTSGETFHLSFGLEDLFPGWGYCYGIAVNELQVGLSVYAAFAAFQVVASSIGCEPLFGLDLTWLRSSIV
jgi:hypothetical protein